MRFGCLLIVALALPATAMAQQLPASVASVMGQQSDLDASQDQPQAAAANATSKLRDQILHTRLTHDFSIGDYLDLTASQGELTRVLKKARPVGGPRWIDERTCQVQLELAGSEVAAMLMGIAHSPTQQSPIRPQALRAKLNGWNRLTFSVVGSSAGGDAIESARPCESAGGWSEVSDSARRSVIEQARGDAARQMIQAVGPIHLTPTVLGSDALARPLVAAPFEHWLNHRPVTRIDFAQDLKVSVTIAAPPEALAGAFRSAVSSDQVFVAKTPVDWVEVDHQIADLPVSVVGTATVVLAAPATSLPSVVLPLQPPDWADEQLQAEATAAGSGPRLRIARRAEAEAIEKIRDQFLQLHLDATTTLADAAHSDTDLDQGVARAILHAHTYRVDYLADGSVKVKVSLDLKDAWDALRSPP